MARRIIRNHPFISGKKPARREAAAKCGAIGSAMCASPAETAAYGASIAGLPGLDASRFLVMPTACGMNVTATYPYAGVVVPVITLSAGACYPTG
jgi:hypothetical protein